MTVTPLRAWPDWAQQLGPGMQPTISKRFSSKDNEEEPERIMAFCPVPRGDLSVSAFDMPEFPDPLSQH